MHTYLPYWFGSKRELYQEYAKCPGCKDSWEIDDDLYEFYEARGVLPKRHFD